MYVNYECYVGSLQYILLLSTSTGLYRQDQFIHQFTGIYICGVLYSCLKWLYVIIILKGPFPSLLLGIILKGPFPNKLFSRGLDICYDIYIRVSLILRKS